jgi:predicted FMN-binding regulatory protein PaiB
MLRKLMLIAAALLALTLAHSYSPPAEAVPLYLEAVASRTNAGTIFVRRHHWSWRYGQQQSGVAVFMIPGLYWGPAWWDPGYSQLCWKKTRYCRGCAENWAFVC